MQALNVKPHGGNRGASMGATAAGGCASTDAKHTTGRGGCQAGRLPIYGPDGVRVVAVLVGGALTKQVDGSRHFLRSPPAIALDSGRGAGGRRARGLTDLHHRSGDGHGLPLHHHRALPARLEVQS